MSPPSSKTPGTQPTSGAPQDIAQQDSPMPDDPSQTGGNAAVGPAVEAQVIRPQDTATPDGGIQTGSNAAAAPAVGAQVVRPQDTSMPDSRIQTGSNAVAGPAVGAQSKKRKRSDEPTSEKPPITATNTGTTAATPGPAIPSQTNVNQWNEILQYLVAVCALLAHIKEFEAQILRGFVIGTFGRNEYLVVLNCLDDLQDSIHTKQQPRFTFPLFPNLRVEMVTALQSGDEFVKVFDGRKEQDLKTVVGEFQMW
ncbi:hypothetical protein LTR37_019593 [Vermiconidia calcicola]|uniref:Uncharacterized protein n=1 Tax=Vermiconidia calcicola TaxID=1690605 RepID=A0ACC3MDN8_9PEZI|nr:hypothetical protein LTR37_019593 [Vermiconidia calcicola]